MFPLPQHYPQNSSTTLTFESALYTVSECLADARCSLEQGKPRRADALYAAAERYALRTGYLELLRLVWAYNASPAEKAAERPPRRE